MSSILSWQLPSPEPRLAARRYLVRRRDCLQPIRTAVFQHPDLAPMITWGTSPQHAVAVTASGPEILTKL